MSLRPSWCPVSQTDGLGGGGAIFYCYLSKNLTWSDHRTKKDEYLITTKEWCGKNVIEN